MARYNAKESEKHWQAEWDNARAVRHAAISIPPNPNAMCWRCSPIRRGASIWAMSAITPWAMCIARFRRAQGYNVLHPMGWDAFGLPAENAARDKGVNPRDWTYENIAAMRAELKLMGLSIDWSREFATCDPAYYHQQQKLFLQFYKAGFVYRGEADVNWDPVDMTVLANEQVIDGRGWRSGALVERRKLSANGSSRSRPFAEELLSRAGHAGTLAGKSPPDAEELDRPQRRPELPVRRCPMQRKAGRVHHPARHAVRRQLRGAVARTSPDPGTGEDRPEACRISSPNAARPAPRKRKSRRPRSWAIDTGLTAAHPFDPDWKLPVMVANFVLMGYGTGAIFGCPAHDQRDLDFARKYGLTVTPVVVPSDADPKTFAVGNEAYTGPGKLANSRFLDGMTVEQAKAEVAARLEKAGIGKRTVNYRLRDWLVSRQRPWGCPIPMVHCAKCGVVPVPEEQLPVLLPEMIDFSVKGNPLDRDTGWKTTTCPGCGGAAVRDTDTLDTFADSSWYFARFTDPHAADAGQQAGGGLLAAGGSIYRRHRACDPASALCPLLHPRHEQAGSGVGGRAFRRPVHPRHGLPRDLQGRATATGSRPTRSRSATARPSCKRSGAPKSRSARPRKCPSRKRM